MTIHFYLERKKLKSKEISIYCYIRGLQKNKTIILNTKEKINPNYWDKVKERAIDRGKDKYLGANELNDFLENYRERIKKIVRNILLENPSADFEDMRLAIYEKFGKIQKKYFSFFETLDLFIETRKRDLSPETIKKYITIKKHLKEFEKEIEKQIVFKKIDLLFYDKFLGYLIERKNLVNNSAYKLIGLLKIFLNWAFDRGVNPVQDFRKFKVKEEKVDIVTLNEDELNNLYNQNLSNDKRLEKARDLFVFGCYTGGRFGDLTSIEWSDIRDDVWYLRVKKTRDLIEIPLNDFAKSIIDRYEGSLYPLPRISNQKLNVYIKEICEKAKISQQIKIVRYSGSTQISFEEPKYKFVTVHTARRTFITQSLLKGMKTEIVMSISGHKNFKTFKKYLDITRKDKEEELKRAWNNNNLHLINTKAI